MDLSFDTLEGLEDKIQLYSCPLMTLADYLQYYGHPEHNLTDDKLVCYPFVIVDTKKNNQDESDFCYCQAANGCSASLSMLEAAKKYHGSRHSAQVIEPVVSFTFVGPEVKVWLAFTKELTTANSWKHGWSSKHVGDNCW